MTDEQIFGQIIQLPVDERAAFLASECKDQPELKTRIEALIAAHEQADSLFDTEAMSFNETSVERPIHQTIGDFEILRELGRGGMGVVYEARQKSLKRKVALKVLSSGLGLSSKAILRFRREAEAAGKLHHTNIVPIYTTGEDKGIHYYAMELIDGPSLDVVIKNLKQETAAKTEKNQSEIDVPNWLRKTALYDASGPSQIRNDASSVSSSSTVAQGSKYFDQVATMIAEVADALEHAHEHGVIHRDIKPSNLLLAPDGRLSINDFGLARMLEQPGMTMSGEFVGSPLYMSPEQITAGRVTIDHRIDIYSLGATLYELLTLQPPFPGQTRDQVFSQILQKDPVSPRRLNRKVPTDLDTICMKAIDKDPDSRYQTAGTLAKDLRAFVNRHAISAKRSGPVVKAWKLIRRNAAVTLLTLLCLLLVLFGFVLYDIDRRKDLRDSKEAALEYIIFGSLDKAEKECLNAADLRASKPWFLRTQGHIALYRGNYESAASYLLEAASYEWSIPIRCLLANVYFNTGDEARYFAEFDKLRRIKPETTEEKLFLGLAGVWQDPKLASDLLESALQQEPNSTSIRYSKGYADLNRAVDATDPSELEKYLRSAVDCLERCLADWPDNAIAKSTLLQAYLVATTLGIEIDGRHRMNELAEQLRADTVEGEPLLTIYYYLQSHDHRAAADFVFSMLDDERCSNYLAAYALIQCYRTGTTDAVDKAYSLIQESPSFTPNSSVSSTKQSFKELAMLSTIKHQSEFDQRLAEFKSYLAEKHGQGDYSHFEEDWLVLWLYESSEADRDNLIRQSKSHFTKFSAPMQADLMPVLEFLLDGDKATLLAECARRESRRMYANAFFAIGVKALADEREDDARDAFQSCVQQNVYQYYVHQWSLAFLERMPKRPKVH